MRTRAFALVFVTALAALAVSSEARAGNAETFYMGNDAALLGGAASASVQGASAVWYNPARIDEGRADAIDLSASAYLLRFGGTADLQAAPGIPATSQKLEVLDFTAVPTALAYKRELFGVRFGIGLFVPNRTVSNLRTLVRLQPPGQSPAEAALVGNSTFNEYYAGAGFGTELAPGLSLGGSLFGYYSSEIDTFALAARSGSFQIGTSGTFDDQRVGLQGVTGLSWKVAPRVRLGFVLRSPVLQVLQQTQQSELSVGTAGGESSANIAFDENVLGTRSAVLTPLRAEAGVAIDVTRTTTIAVGAKMRGQLTAQDESRTAVPMIDLRAGGRSRISRSLWLGGGLFSDRSAAPRSGRAAQTVLDYYGTTLGLELGTPYRVVDQEERAHTMVFATAFAFSYALGVGSLGNLAVTPQNDGGLVIAGQRQDVVAHELMFLIGTTVSTTDR